jgi:hypothetical protein
MNKLANATQNTRVYDRFEYVLADLDCAYCVHFISNVAAKHNGGRGCGRSRCEFQDLRDECMAAGRIKRAKGAESKWRE